MDQYRAELCLYFLHDMILSRKRNEVRNGEVVSTSSTDDLGSGEVLVEEETEVETITEKGETVEVTMVKETVSHIEPKEKRRRSTRSGVQSAEQS